MPNVNDHDDVGCSSNKSVLLDTLLDVVESLLKGTLDLEKEVNEIEQRRALADFTKKGKRSPRTKKAGFDELIFKDNPKKLSNVVCTLEPVSKKMTMKKPSSENSCKRTMNSEEEEGTISTKRAKESSVAMGPAPVLPEDFRNRILETGGDLLSVVLVIQKELTKTDMSTGHGRLSVPYRKIKNEFLKSSEANQLNTEKRGIKTSLIQPCLEECQINLRNWKSNSEYVLVRDWNKVCNRNELREGMKIQLWAFRKNSSQLCFALVKID